MAQGSITIRRAGDDELDRVASVWHRSASAMDGAVSPMPSCDDLRQRIDDELTTGWELYVAEREDRIVGLLAIKPCDAVLDQVFVLPAEQGAGVGSALLDLAKQRMPDGFGLRMASANARAARFYRRSGLDLAGSGLHPVSGRPVCFYRWKRR